MWGLSGIRQRVTEQDVWFLCVFMGAHGTFMYTHVCAHTHHTYMHTHTHMHAVHRYTDFCYCLNGAVT